MRRFHMRTRCRMIHVEYRIGGSVSLVVMSFRAVDISWGRKEPSNTKRSFFPGITTNACGFKCRLGTKRHAQFGNGKRYELRSSLFTVFITVSKCFVMVGWVGADGRVMGRVC